VALIVGGIAVGIVATVATCGLAGPLVAGLAIAATVVSTATAVNDLIEATTGVDPMKEGIIALGGNEDVYNGIRIGLDVATMLAPGGGGKAGAIDNAAGFVAKHGDDAARLAAGHGDDAARAAGKADGAGTASTIDNAAPSIVRGTERKNPTQIREIDAVDSWDQYLGTNTTNVNPISGVTDNNRIFSADGTRSIRFGNHEMGSLGTNSSHFHYETWIPDSASDTVIVDNVLQRMK
jgi:hypothetical protein